MDSDELRIFVTFLIGVAKNEIVLNCRVLNLFMRSSLYIFVGILLIIIGLVGPVAYFLPHTRSMNEIALDIMLLFPLLSSPLVIGAGLTYVWLVVKRREISADVGRSLQYHLFGIASIVLAALFGGIPCAYFPRDGFCMIFGLPFLVLSFAMWIAGPAELFFALRKKTS